MKKLRTAMLIGAAWYVAALVIGHEHPTELMFNPETDGPILAEAHPSFGLIRPGSPGLCMTSVPVSSSSAAGPVFATCGAITASTSTAFTVTTGGAR